MNVVLFVAVVGGLMTAGVLIRRSGEKRWQDPRVGKFR